MVIETWRALCAPKRMLPIAALSIALVAAQATVSARDPLGVPLAIAACVAFVVFAPLAWRALIERAHGIGLLFRSILYVVIATSIMGALGHLVPRLAGMSTTFLTARSNLAVAIALFIVGGWGLGRDIALELALSREQQRARKLADAVEAAQLLAIRSHLDPHFLFNTLNAIAEWCREDGETAERAVLSLSSILRAILRGVRAEVWPLRDELALVRSLFELHAMRDPSAFELRWNVGSDIERFAVPPLILLPLAENAMKHGPAKGHRGIVEVRVERNGEGIDVTIENPGAYAGERDGGEGLRMITRRIELAYGRDARFSIRGEGARTIAALSLGKELS